MAATPGKRAYGLPRAKFSCVVGCFESFWPQVGHNEQLHASPSRKPPPQADFTDAVRFASAVRRF
jgi:hypothetical protein